MAQNFIALKSKSKKQWLEIRQQGIGGSDIAAILGLNKYRTALDVYQDKLGIAEEIEENEAMHFGTILEDVVAQEFAERVGLRVQRVNATICTGKDFWMRANIDRAIVNPDIAGNVRIKEQKGTNRILTTDAILECKTAGFRSAHLWGPSQELEIATGEVTSEHEIPVQYELQVQWYMAVTGVSKAYVAVLIAGQEFRCYEVDRNEALIAQMTQYAHKFWFENVCLKKAPEPTNSKDLKAACPIDNGNLAEASNETAVDIGEYRNLKGRIKEMEDELEVIAERIRMSIGGNEGLTLGGEKACTWKTSFRQSIDTKKLKSDFPEVWAKVQKEPTAIRTFKVY